MRVDGCMFSGLWLMLVLIIGCKVASGSCQGKEEEMMDGWIGGRDGCGG